MSRAGQSAQVDANGRVRTPVGIWDLLQWAFQREAVSLDFDPLERIRGERAGVDTLYILGQRNLLGCPIDGGGRSDPHPDADQVADALVQLPEGCGGRGMATWIADLARSGMVPEWRPKARPRCVPEEWRNGKHGRHARTAPIGTERNLSRGRTREVPVLWCPVLHLDEARDRARLRRRYLQWWSALLELRETFRIHDSLSAWEVTEAMPPMAPWKETA